MPKQPLKPIAPSDAIAIAALEMLLFPDNCFNEKTLAEEIKIGEGFVIYEDEFLVGYLLARREGDVLDILRLGVRLDCQHDGLGTELLSAAIKDEPHVILTVRKDNGKALNLYYKFGFEIVGVSEYSWVMRLHRG